MFLVNFFKACGKGLLYVITLPITLLVLAIYSVVGIVIFVGLSLKSVILFFKGKTIFSNLPEDDEAQEILKKQATNPSGQFANDQVSLNPTANNNSNPIAMSVYPSDSSMYQNTYSSPVFDEVKKEEIPNHENGANENVNHSSPIANTNEENKTEQKETIIQREEEPEANKEEEVIGTYEPRKESRAHWWSKK